MKIFAKKSRKAFELEAWALEGSSFFISATLLALSFYLWEPRKIAEGNPKCEILGTRT